MARFLGRGVPSIPRSAKVHRPRVSTATSAVATRSTRGRCRTAPSATPGRGRLGRLAFADVRHAQGRRQGQPSPSSRQGLHRQQGRPLAPRHERLTVYTTRKHPLTNPTERNLYPQVRDARGGPLRRVSWDARWTASPMRSSARWTGGGPRRSGCGATISPEMKLPPSSSSSPKGPVQQGAGSRRRCRGACDPQPPEVELEHPSIEQHFGSNSTLLYSYRDFELADTILLSGANSYVTGTCSTTACSRGRTGRS